MSVYVDENLLIFSPNQAECNEDREMLKGKETVFVDENDLNNFVEKPDEEVRLANGLGLVYVTFKHKSNDYLPPMFTFLPLEFEVYTSLNQFEDIRLVEGPTQKHREEFFWNLFPYGNRYARDSKILEAMDSVTRIAHINFIYRGIDRLVSIREARKVREMKPKILSYPENRENVVQALRGKLRKSSVAMSYPSIQDLVEESRVIKEIGNLVLLSNVEEIKIKKRGYAVV